MDELLLELLETLEEIGRSQEEIYDPDCRERMGDAVFALFIKPTPGYELPEDFGLLADDANQRVRAALRRYVDSARELAATLGVADFHARLAAFQNRDVRTSRERTQFDDFFGWSDPACFDNSGRVVDFEPGGRPVTRARRQWHWAVDAVKSGAILRAIGKRAIYVCLVVFFALCWFSHYLARLAMEICNRHFLVMDGKTMRAMALIDWIAVHWWLAIAYVSLVVASVAFLQIRGRPPWTYWVTAVFFCIPGFAYWLPCALIAGKLLMRP
jgi:hypothetical protein